MNHFLAYGLELLFRMTLTLVVFEKQLSLSYLPEFSVSYFLRSSISRIGLRFLYFRSGVILFLRVIKGLFQSF